MLQLGMPSSTLTLTEPARPTPHCRTFIILGLFCGFEGFSVTEGHKRSTHTRMPRHTQLNTVMQGTHTCSHTIMHGCTHMYTHSYIHSCTTATHIITHEVMHRHTHITYTVTHICTDTHIVKDIVTGKYVCTHIDIHTHAQAHTITQSWSGTQEHTHIVSYTFTVTHTNGTHTQLHKSCVQTYTLIHIHVYTQHMCTQVAHIYSCTHTCTHIGAHIRHPETCLSHGFFLYFYNLHLASLSENHAFIHLSIHPFILSMSNYYSQPCSSQGLC